MDTDPMSVLDESIYNEGYAAGLDQRRTGVDSLCPYISDRYSTAMAFEWQDGYHDAKAGRLRKTPLFVPTPRPQIDERGSLPFTRFVCGTPNQFDRLKRIESLTMRQYKEYCEEQEFLYGLYMLNAQGSWGDNVRGHFTDTRPWNVTEGAD